jgi:hypothetical protein
MISLPDDFNYGKRRLTRSTCTHERLQTAAHTTTRRPGTREKTFALSFHFKGNEMIIEANEGK